MNYPYPSPPSLGHGQAPSALSATEEAVAYVAALSRQRSSSSDTLGPDAKRARSTSPSTAAPIEPVSLQRWLQSVATPPLDREHHHHATIPSSALSHSLSDLEFSQAWSYLPPPANPSHSAATLGLGFVDTPNSAESFEYHNQRLAGVQTNFHPTPVATPQHHSFHAHQHDSSTTAAGRPVNLRSTTAPVHSSRGIAELKASGGQDGSAQFGSEIELRARGEELRRQLGAGQGVARSSTDLGIKVGGEVLNKDRFVAGLVGASVLAIESIWGPTSPECTAATAMSPDGAVLPLHWFVKEVLRRSRTSCSTLQLALYYLHKSRREIREIVARADTSRDEYCRLEKQLAAEREAHILGDSYPSPPLSPVSDQGQYSINPQQRFADLMETQNSPVLCGRRMFLASLIGASKFLQDRNYSNRAWARISGLPVTEINVNERAFLNMMKFQLHLGAHDFQKWTERLAALTTQGAVLESAAAAASSSRIGLGLARSQSDYPVEQPTEDLLRTTRPPISTVGRSHSEAEVSASSSSASAAAIAASRQALVAKMNERRLAAATASTKPLLVTQQQTASPVDSDASSSSPGDESSSTTSSSSSTARKVRGMPIRRLPQQQRQLVQQHGSGIPLVRSGSQSSLGSNRGWTAGAASSAMDVDQASAQVQAGGAQGWSRWGIPSAGVAAH